MNQKNNIESFAQARQEKRLLFHQRWNQFAQSWFIHSALIFLSVAFALFAIFSGSFIYEQAIALRIMGEQHPFWCDLLIFGLQILVAVPGGLFIFGLWKIQSKTRWQDGQEPDLSGFQLLKWVNYTICILTGILLALYPTIIIYSGEYLKEDELLHLFYLLLSSTVLFALCITFVRIVIRTAEENVSCCWANSRFVLLLTIILFFVVPAVVVFAPLEQPFYIAVAALAGGFSYLLFIYWLFLRKTALLQGKIDLTVISNHENPDDPYSWY